MSRGSRKRRNCCGCLAGVAAVVVAVGVASCLLRGPLYRAFFTYQISDVRQEGCPPTANVGLADELSAWASAHPDADIEDISLEALRATARHLRFSLTQDTDDPDGLVDSGRAHCVGYGAVYCGAVAYLMEEAGLSGRYRCDHLAAHIHLLGRDVHPIVDHPFFRDHDYGRIVDLKTGDEWLADPSLFDYLRVARVRGRE